MSLKGTSQSRISVAYSKVKKLTYEFDMRPRRWLPDERIRWLRIEYKKASTEDVVYLQLGKREYHKIIPAVGGALGKEVMARFQTLEP